MESEGTGAANNPFLATADAISEAIAAEITTEKTAEKPIEAGSQLAMEISSVSHPISRHFLTELPKHCGMLAVAVDDACRALGRLNRELPFSCTVLVRGLMEAAADLYWLTDTRINVSERARRTFLVYLIQVETRVRQMEQYRQRIPDAKEELPLDKAIKEGWQLLQESAEGMASAGYQLSRNNRRPGPRYFLGERKPAINRLVDDMVKELYGTTALNLYSIYSSAAHVEGEGLGSLMDLTDNVNTIGGTKYAYGLDEEKWLGRIIRPGTRIAIGATRMWLKLALPTQLEEFDSKIANLVTAIDRLSKEGDYLLMLGAGIEPPTTNSTQPISPSFASKTGGISRSH